MDKKLQLIQRLIDLGLYKPSSEKIAEKLLKKNIRLTENIKEVKNEKSSI